MNEWNTQHNPPPPPATLFVESVGASENKRFIVYSTSFFGMWTHYHNYQTTPCYKDHSKCILGHDPKTLRWKSYLHAYSETRKEAVFIQLTPGAVWKFLKTIGNGISLRGLTIQVARTEKKNGRLAIAIDHYKTVNLASLPKPMDPRKSLERLWKIDAIPALLNAQFLGGADDIPPEALTA